MDWQTVVARRAKKEAPDKGGWNIFFTTTVTVDADNPAGNSFSAAAATRRGSAGRAMRRWRSCGPPTRARAIPKTQADRARRFRPHHGPGHYIVLGQYKAFGAYRKDRISGWLAGPVPVWWNITKKN